MNGPTVWWSDAGHETESYSATFNPQTNIAQVKATAEAEPVAVPRSAFIAINFDARHAWKVRDVPVRIDGLSPDLRQYLLAAELMEEMASKAEKPDAYVAWRVKFVTDAGGGATREQLQALYPNAPL